MVMNDPAVDNLITNQNALRSSKGIIHRTETKLT